VSYDGEILHADAYRPYPKHLLGFISKGEGSSLPNMTFFNKNSRPTNSQPRPMLLIALLLIAQHRQRTGPSIGWLHAGPLYSDLASTSLSDWP